MKIKEIIMTPKAAAALLEKNMLQNRRMVKARVAILAADMQAGRWYQTGETVKVNTAGFLVDGQHRLAAVVQSGCTVEMLVAYDVPDQSVRVIDTGKSRSAADLLTMQGVGTNAAQRAALAKRIMSYEKGKKNVIGRQFTKSTGITNEDVLEFCLQNDLQEYLSFGWKVYSIALSRTMYSQTDWSTLYYILAQKDKDKAEEFLTALATLEGLSRSSVIRQLYEKINNRKMSLTNNMKVSLTFRTWNAWRKGETFVNLRLELGGKEDIQEPV